MSTPAPVPRSATVRAVNATTSALGSVAAVVLSVLVVVVWGLTGPLFGFSDTWQLVINTFTTVATFVMVFVIQNSQNRDNLAIQVKLDEIIYSMREADDGIVGVEDLTERELKDLQQRVRNLAGP